MKLLIHFHFVPRVRIRGRLPPLSSHAFTASGIDIDAFKNVNLFLYYTLIFHLISFILYWDMKATNEICACSNRKYTARSFFLWSEPHPLLGNDLVNTFT
jgi:hypothetical protein